MKKERLNEITNELIETMPAFILEMAYRPNLGNSHTGLANKINDVLKKDNASDGTWTRDILNTSIGYIENILKKEELDSNIRLKLNKLVEYAKPVYKNIELEGFIVSDKAYRKGFILAEELSKKLSITLKD